MKMTPEQLDAKLETIKAYVSEAELAAFVAALTGNFDANYKANGFTNPASVRIAEAQVGQKRARIVQKCPDASPDGFCHASAYCFVDLATGDILKTASWNAPAKGVRGNIRVGDASNWWNGALTPYGAAYLR